MKIKKTNGLLPIMLILILSFAIEALFANFAYFAYVSGNDGVTDYICEDAKTVVLDWQNEKFTVGVPDFELNSISFNVSHSAADNESRLVTAEISIYDENNIAESFSVRREKIAVGNDIRNIKFYMRSQGKANGVEVGFYDFDGEITVSDVKLNSGYKFDFNLIRFALLFVFGCLVYVLRSDGNAKKLRDKTDCGTASAISSGVCVAVTLFFWYLTASGENGNCYSYPLEGYIENYSPYIQQFDAFMKGQLHIDVVPTEEMLSLENPYNLEARDGIYYLYDRAFYGGKYYSYFGIAPILLIYIPFYLITGLLPADSTVMGILTLITAVFVPLTVVKYAKLRNINIRPWLAAICGAGAFFASCALIIQRGFTPFYYIASAAGTAFVSAFALFMLCALDEKKRSNRIIFFVLAGTGFALAFLSRLNSVVAPAIMIAVFVVFYAIKKIKEKEYTSLITEMLALAAPVAVSLVFSLYYNYIRFDNPLQFGADYQLTIADASLYELGADGIVPSFIHYFLQPFGILSEFPYIGFEYMRLSDYGRFIYVDSNFGIFAVPFMISLLLSVMIFGSKRYSRQGKALLASGIASLFITAFANYCLGGVIFRYTADISLVAAFLSAVILLEICTENQNSKYGTLLKKSAVVLCAVTAVVVLAAATQLNGNLVSYDPDIYMGLKNFFVLRS